MNKITSPLTNKEWMDLSILKEKHFLQNEFVSQWESFDELCKSIENSMIDYYVDYYAEN